MNNAATTRKYAKRFAKGQVVEYRCCQNHGWQPATYLFGTVDFCQVQLADGNRRNIFKFPGWGDKIRQA